MIIVRIWEGLGNQMFQYAYAKALSIRINQPVYLDVRATGTAIGDVGVEREYKLDNFRISLQQFPRVNQFYPFLSKSNMYTNVIKKMSEHSFWPFIYYREETVVYNEELMRLRGNRYIQAYFQNEKYFKEYENVIRKEFRPKEKIKISNELKKILRSKNTVSIHVRRGDYKKLKSELPLRYYGQAINYVKRHIENPFWIIFSDEPVWVKDNLMIDNQSYYVSGNERLKDYEELLIMSRCKNHIISNSTFSWWGAWLDGNKDKVVVGPQRWFWGQMSNHKTNIMPPEWKRIPI